jgi:hypothetical protein
MAQIALQYSSKGQYPVSKQLGGARLLGEVAVRGDSTALRSPCAVLADRTAGFSTAFRCAFSVTFQARAPINNHLIPGILAKGLGVLAKHGYEAAFY